MNIAKMMKQAQQMQKKMAEMQAEVAEQEVEASVGGGKVVVKANGAGDVLEIKIDPAVVDADDVELLEDLVLSGVKQAIEKGKARKWANSPQVWAFLPEWDSNPFLNREAEVAAWRLAHFYFLIKFRISPEIRRRTPPPAPPQIPPLSTAPRLETPLELTMMLTITPPMIPTIVFRM